MRLEALFEFDDFLGIVSWSAKACECLCFPIALKDCEHYDLSFRFPMGCFFLFQQTVTIYNLLIYQSMCSNILF